MIYLLLDLVKTCVAISHSVPTDDQQSYILYNVMCSITTNPIIEVKVQYFGMHVIIVESYIIPPFAAAHKGLTC